jgi:hypothetical protein
MGENKLSEPPKSVWSCGMVVSIDRKFYMEQEKYYFWGQKDENKTPILQNQYDGRVSMDPKLGF